MGYRHFTQALPEETAEITAFNRSFWVGGQSGVKDSDVVALIRDAGYGCTDVAAMYGLSRARIGQIAARNGLKTMGSLPRLWDAALSRFRAMTREEWWTRKRLLRKAQRRQRLFQKHEVERQRHVCIARQLARELGRAPTIQEIAAKVGRQSAGMLRYWGFDSRKIGQQTGRRATERLYRAAGLEKRGVGGAGHVVPGVHMKWKRKLTPEQVLELWENPHPYGKTFGLIRHKGIEQILNRESYRDITADWPEPAYRRTA